jgi:hypothetical protein
MTEIDQTPGCEKRCPLCGGDNRCAMTATPPGETCWCQSVAFDPALLASLTESGKGIACLCPECSSVEGNAREG